MIKMKAITKCTGHCMSFNNEKKQYTRYQSTQHEKFETIHYRKLTALFIQCNSRQKKIGHNYVRHKATTTNDLKAPDMGQAHKEYDRAKHLDIVYIDLYNFCNLFSSILIFFCFSSLLVLISFYLFQFIYFFYFLFYCVKNLFCYKLYVSSI